MFDICELILILIQPFLTSLRLFFISSFVILATANSKFSLSGMTEKEIKSKYASGFFFHFSPQGIRQTFKIISRLHISLKIYNFH